MDEHGSNSCNAIKINKIPVQNNVRDDNEQLTIYSVDSQMIEEKLVQWLLDIKANLSKCRYRKVLRDIEMKLELYTESTFFWKIIELKIRAMLKIVNKKMQRHEIEPEDGNSNSVKSIELWFHRIDSELEKWMNTIKQAPMTKTILEKKIDYKEQLEIIVQLFIELLYCIALFSKKLNRIPDCIAYLAICERTIKTFSDYTTDQRSINIQAKVLLFISNILIADNDYESAKYYQAKCLKLCFRELFITVDLEIGLMIESLSKEKRYSIGKTIANIILCFYHRGACEENLGNLTKAVDAYRQSRWFALKFLKEDFPELTQFVYDVEKRALGYYNLINRIKEKKDNLTRKERERERKKAKLNKIEEEKNELNLRKIVDGNYLNLEKFSSIKQKIEKLEIPNLEISLHSHKDHPVSAYCLSTVHLINDLLSDEFKEIIKQMDKLEFNKMDKETQEKLQRKLNELQNEKKIIQTSQEFKLEYKDNLFKSKSESLMNFTKRKNQTLLDTNRQSSYRHFCKYNHNEVEKISCNQYVFSDQFKKKQRFLDKLNSKELSFQKQLLNLKRYEKNPNENSFDIRRVKSEISSFYNRVIGSLPKANTVQVNSKNGKIQLHKSFFKKNNIIKDRLENATVTSLNTQKLKELKDFIKLSQSQQRFTLREEFAGKLNRDLNKALSDMSGVKKKNNEFLKSISQEIAGIDQRNVCQMKNIRSISQTKSRIRISYANGYAKKSSDKMMNRTSVKDMSQFVKRDKFSHRFDRSISVNK